MSETEVLILESLKNILEYNETPLSNPSATAMNIWIMALSVLPYSKEYFEFLPACLDENQLLESEQAFLVRVILRTTDSEGSNGYVDGTTLGLTIDLNNGEVRLINEEQILGDSPEFHGGAIADAMTWIQRMTKPFYIQYKDPFFTASERIMLNGHDLNFARIPSSDKSTNSIDDDDWWP